MDIHLILLIPVFSLSCAVYLKCGTRQHAESVSPGSQFLSPNAGISAESESVGRGDQKRQGESETGMVATWHFQISTLNLN